MFDTNLNQLIDRLGVKYIFIKSGLGAKRDQLADYPEKTDTKKFYCELSWGTAGEDMFDFATKGAGDTPDEAIRECVSLFFYLYFQGYKPVKEIRDHLLKENLLDLNAHVKK
jgi:hypothetical protein